MLTAHDWRFFCSEEHAAEIPRTNGHHMASLRVYSSDPPQCMAARWVSRH